MNKDIIGIDPDLRKSGVARINNNKLIFCESITMWDLFDYIKNNKDCLYLLEAGHLNKNCWHSGGRGASSNVGKGKAVGIIIQDFMDAIKIEYRLIKPKGYSNFFKNKDFFKLQTNWDKQTNLDARAAAAIAWLNK